MDVVRWAESRVRDTERSGLQTPEEEVLLEQHRSLMSGLDDQFRGRMKRSWPRVLIHVPPPQVALAWSSTARNTIDCLRYLGIEAYAHPWNVPISKSLELHQPNVFLTLWPDTYLEQIDWEVVRRYRETSRLMLGINAPEEETYGRQTVDQLLEWATKSKVSFFFKERPQPYLARSYSGYWAAGYEVLALEFGANPLLYHPVAGVTRDLEYCFMGSLHRDKWSRYLSYFGPIIKERAGFVLGPGWPTGPCKTLVPEAHRFVYGRSLVGLNLHHPLQLRETVEMNERTYNLAAAGVTQVMDRPALLAERFSDDAFFVGDSPSEFRNNVSLAINNRDEAFRRALLAHDQVLRNHTMFHRLTEFLENVERVAETG
jgi:hypothetical protein